jgi:hypothetical protein
MKKAQPTSQGAPDWASPVFVAWLHSRASILFVALTELERMLEQHPMQLPVLSEIACKGEHHRAEFNVRDPDRGMRNLPRRRAIHLRPPNVNEMMRFFCDENLTVRIRMNSRYSAWLDQLAQPALGSVSPSRDRTCQNPPP